MKKTGFTLIEIIVASVLLAVIIVGVFGVALFGRRMTTRSGRMLEGENAAVDWLERLKNDVGLDWANNNLSSGSWSAWTNLPAPLGNAPYNGRRRYIVQQFDPVTENFTYNDDFDKPKRVSLQINWTEPTQ